MQLIDTHTHLFLPEFDSDRAQVIENALQKGVYKMLLPNVDSTTIENLVQLTKNYPEHFYQMIGLHPTSVNKDFKHELGIVENWLQKEKFIAIGEIGIDLYWDKTYLAQQQEAFLHQINLAKKHDLPIAIHARESFNEIFDILKQEIDGNLKGVFHAFTGNLKQANQIIEWGFKIGIGGIVTFKNSGLDDIVKNIDINHIVLESDSPYLPPVPYRGKRNESAYILNIAEKIAQIKNLSLADVAQITKENAKDLFRL
ncbi:MAG: hydrolase TatD [Bacteroidetes bacterium GWC2_33_15]|nr:MAG: hydrolase TatD [Bacteroidetes bacterium GWA2_33_15]OFX52713.1 MAG: hydrolase TatD [Bacteroidetes bacterium GWC2_33_15]OFX63981.1 MAG: hydrolase TatD [Bacteroidetes bacterium GWB2_32_14]OFX67334.1 MAG: hydrolase TatD [Bacteroidetes bacterium GWD2_33_33]HAN18799.1 hydrolase TatD [Bacteroidales bacterium]